METGVSGVPLTLLFVIAGTWPECRPLMISIALVSILFVLTMMRGLFLMTWHFGGSHYNKRFRTRSKEVL